MAQDPTTVLAFDLGATSGRAILGALDRGKLQFRELHRFPNDPVRYNGDLHWDVPRLWHEVQAGLHLAAQHDRPPASIGLDTWGVDYALLGEGGVLLENPYHYRDQRTHGMLEEACRILGSGRIYDATGIQFMGFNTLFQVFAASRRTPKLLATAEALLTMPDLLNFWLTGVKACEYTNATTTQFLDRRNGQWARELLTGLGIPTHFLQPIIQPGTVLGSLRPELTASGALKGARVVAPACHDTGFRRSRRKNRRGRRLPQLRHVVPAGHRSRRRGGQRTEPAAQLHQRGRRGWHVPPAQEHHRDVAPGGLQEGLGQVRPEVLVLASSSTGPPRPIPCAP